MLLSLRKALIRSHLWQPAAWDASTRSIGARQFASLLGNSQDQEGVRKTEEILEQAYKTELY